MTPQTDIRSATGTAREEWVAKTFNLDLHPPGWSSAFDVANGDVKGATFDKKYGPAINFSGVTDAQLRQWQDDTLLYFVELIHERVAVISWGQLKTELGYTSEFIEHLLSVVDEGKAFNPQFRIQVQTWCNARKSRHIFQAYEVTIS